MLLIILLSCKEKNGDFSKSNDTTYSINKTEILQSANKTILESYIATYIDSINQASNESELPNFLADNQFDYRNRGFWTSVHTPFSIRAQIINRVNSCRALQLVVHSPNQQYKKKPDIEGELVVPFSDLSFYDLALKRLAVLDCNKTK
jgi:hypothetical protein